MPFVILPTNSASGGYDITNSLRFNSGSSDYLSRTPATTTNRRTWTWSSWVKKSVVSSTQVLFTAYTTNTDSGYLFARIDNGTGVIRIASGTGSINFITTPVYRDISAWYHIMFSVDTTQATSTNRVKIYINGSQVTDFSTGTYPAQNFDSAVNGNWSHNIGRDAQDGSGLFNGYLAETYLIDGQQLEPSSFGETDFDTGIWKPKAYTGTYGTNGFYLQFKNSASLGTDSSGNGNTFTVNNLTSIDQTTDTPTNNFCTLNPLYQDTSGNNEPSYSNGNVQYTPTVDGNAYTKATIAVSSGKWYAEMKVTSGTQQSVFYWSPADTTNNTYYYGIQLQYASGFETYAKIVNTTNTSLSSSLTSPTILMLAIDFDNGKMWVGRNGDWYNNNNISTALDPANPDATGITSNTWIPSFNVYYDLPTGRRNTNEVNFGNPSFTIASGNADGNGYGNFEYAVPSGFYALCTKNLATFG
jgi:hypothetical protein